MIKTACLDTISIEVAQELTGNAQTEELLERFVRRNVFTVKRPGSGTYQYHPLLKQFLKNREAAAYTLPERQLHLKRAATILSAHGQVEEAIPPWLVAEAWTEAAGAIVKLAPALAQQGRFKTLSTWILAIPAAERAADAWLTYWLGACQMVIDFPAARQISEAAYELFEARYDVLGQMLAASDVILHYHMSFVDFTPALVWIDRLRQLLESKPSFPSIDVELRVLGSFFSYAPQIDAQMRRHVERAKQLIYAPVDINCKAYAISSLLTCMMLSGDAAQIQQLIPAIETLNARTDVASINLAHVQWMYSYYWHLIGNEKNAWGCSIELCTSWNFMDCHL